MTQKISFEISQTTLDISTKRLLKEVVKEKLLAIDLPGTVIYKEILDNVLIRRRHTTVFNLLVKVSIKSRKFFKREEADILREGTGLFGVDIFWALHGVNFPPEEDFQYRGWHLRVVVYRIDFLRGEENEHLRG